MGPVNFCPLAVDGIPRTEIPKSETTSGILTKISAFLHLYKELLPPNLEDVAEKFEMDIFRQEIYLFGTYGFIFCQKRISYEMYTILVLISLITISQFKIGCNFSKCPH